MNHRRTAVAATAAALIATMTLGACNRADRQEARTEGRQATAQASAAVDDAAITTKVKAALLADDQVKGTQINVDTNGGTVKLTGTVDSATQVARAMEIARGVNGVQKVENNLTASASAAPGMVPGTQPPGTSPSATPMPNSTTPPKSSSGK
ncbi:MAG TPA: BON domain-containing protein [Burkholderiaceae bacterium]|nr:BON domain-containing protein [Burkholderiaceae bacterium]